MATRILDMAKKRGRKPVPESERIKTELVRLPSDQVRLINAFASYEGVSVSAYLTPLLKPDLDREHARINEEIKKRKEG